MGRYITADLITENETEVRYALGGDLEDRLLVIQKDSWEASLEGEPTNSLGGIVVKIKKAWSDSGEFPSKAYVAS